MENSYKLLREFKHFLQRNGKQFSTVNCYSSDVKEFLNYTQLNKIDYRYVDHNHLETYKQYLHYDCNDSSNSIRRKTIGIKQFYRFISEKKIIQSNSLEYAIIPPRNEKLPKQLNSTDIDALFEIALSQTNKLKASRDCAIIALLAIEGIKITELILLEWRDFLCLRNISSLRIKGPRQRILNLNQESAKILGDYKKELKALNHQDSFCQEEHHIFIAFTGRDTSIPKGKISRHGLKFLLYELGEKCDLKHINAELLRHNSIIHQITAGKNAEEIMEHLGLRQRGNIAKHFRKLEKDFETS